VLTSVLRERERERERERREEGGKERETSIVIDAIY